MSQKPLKTRISQEMDSKTETKETMESLRRELEETKRSLNIVSHLYKITETDLDVLLAQYSNLLESYTALHATHQERIKEMIVNLQKAVAERAKITSSSKQ